MGEKGSVYILFGAHQWPCALVFIYAILHSYLPVSSLNMVLSLRKLYCELCLLILYTDIRNYGVPLHLIRELYETFRNRIRIADYVRYRKITSNMNERFPDATSDEINAWVLYSSIGTVSVDSVIRIVFYLYYLVFRSDATCIICCEEMTTAKKLLCGHLFHVHCLRSWLERQHTCPTCRAPIIPPDNGRAASARQHGAQPGVQPGELHFIDLISFLCHIYTHVHLLYQWILHCAISCICDSDLMWEKNSCRHWHSSLRRSTRWDHEQAPSKTWSGCISCFLVWKIFCLSSGEHLE